jgi:hypothetical protein
MYPRNLIEQAAQSWKVDPDRLVAWHAFSEFYLDTSHDEVDLYQIAHALAETPFSIEELSHIAFYEVMPVCIGNFAFAWWPGAEWAGFDDDWLILRCSKRMEEAPFHSSGDPTQPSSRLRLLQPLWFDSCSMVYRVARLRRGEVS